MRVLIVKDGTIPVAVCEVLYTDGFEKDGEVTTELLSGEDTHELLEVFDVPGRPEALWVSWSEDMGFGVAETDFADGLKYLQADAIDGIEEVSPGHFVASYGNPEDPSAYGHLFDLRTR